jgi:hypothetical protein
MMLPDIDGLSEYNLFIQIIKAGFSGYFEANYRLGPQQIFINFLG